ncbi:MAG: T9SS type A sorting domain-containing protein [Bacteroidales bacterium]|nr:T9SS type A sorting domain-containing protein [Bacteroidales bacterium]
MKTLLLTISLLIYNLVLFSQDMKNTTFAANTVPDSIINLAIEPGDPVISSLAKKESADRFANMAPGLLVSPIQTAESQSFVIDAYSMPSSYMLYIQVEGNGTTELRFSLFDNTGKFIKQQKLGGINTELSLEGYPAGKYIIKIVHAMKDMKTFEVYKK